MRPVILNYPDDERAANLNDEYMVGDDLLVAPVVVKAQRRRLVYLPAGEWVDFWNNREYAGNQDIVVDATAGAVTIICPKERRYSVGAGHDARCRYP